VNIAGYTLRLREFIFRNHCFVDDSNPLYEIIRGKERVKTDENINDNIPITGKIIMRNIRKLKHQMTK
jgi:hypothetical protein